MLINDLRIDNSVELLLEDLPNIENDAFNYKEIAWDISNVIRMAKPPFVYAICGTWGSGKSTLLKFLLDFLPSREEKSIVLYFNAWRASIHTNFLSALVKEIIDQIIESKIIRRSKLRGKLRRRGKSILKAAIESFSELTSSTKFIYKLYFKIKKNSLNEFRKNFSAQKQVRDKFEEISRILNGEGLTVFVFIDELDRCSPHIVVQVIEAIRMVFSNHDGLHYSIKLKNRSGDNNVNSPPKIPFKYILTIDEDYVSRAFAVHYNIGINESHMYLSKFIQLKYHFPKRDWQKFVEIVLNKISPIDFRDTFLPDGSIKDLSTFLTYFNKINSPREAHRILAYFTLWQKRFLDRGVHTSVMGKIDQISEDNGTRQTFIKAVNCILILFAIMKVIFPSQVYTIINENLFQKMCRKQEELNEELKKFEDALVDKKIKEELVIPLKMSTDLLNEKFQNIKINREKATHFFEEIVDDMFKR